MSEDMNLSKSNKINNLRETIRNCVSPYSLFLLISSTTYHLKTIKKH